MPPTVTPGPGPLTLRADDPDHAARFEQWAAALPVTAHTWLVTNRGAPMPDRLGPTLTWSRVAALAYPAWWQSATVRFERGCVHVDVGLTDLVLHPLSGEGLSRFDRALVATRTPAAVLLDIADTPVLDCIVGITRPAGYLLEPDARPEWRAGRAVEAIRADLATMTTEQVTVATSLAVTWEPSGVRVAWDGSWAELRDVARTVTR